MDWHSVTGLISSFAVLFPVTVILSQKLFRIRNYLALFIYCMNALLYNLVAEGIIPAGIEISRGVSLYNNMLDVPLMMIVLQVFATSKRQRKIMNGLILSYIAYELIVLASFIIADKNIISDINVLKDMIAVLIGPGLALVLFYGFKFFTQKVKIAVTHQKAYGKAIIISSILFIYSCFSFIYVVNYILQLNSEIKGIFLIYYISTILYYTALGVGLLFENKRIKKLKELQVTRKELSEIFPYTKPAAPQNETADSWRFN